MKVSVSAVLQFNDQLAALDAAYPDAKPELKFERRTSTGDDFLFCGSDVERNEIWFDRDLITVTGARNLDELWSDLAAHDKVVAPVTSPVAAIVSYAYWPFARREIVKHYMSNNENIATSVRHAALGGLLLGGPDIVRTLAVITALGFGGYVYRGATREQRWANEIVLGAHVTDYRIANPDAGRLRAVGHLLNTHGIGQMETTNTISFVSETGRASNEKLFRDLFVLRWAGVGRPLAGWRLDKAFGPAGGIDVR